MKLQVNTSGAWKNVCEFDANCHNQVVAALIPLSRALSAADAPDGPHASVRFSLVDDTGKREWLGTLAEAKTSTEQNRNAK